MTQFLSTSKALAALAAALLAGNAGAAAAQAPDRRADVVEQLVGCRAMTDPAARLACYDAAAGALDEAERSGQLVVLDRAQVEETRRGLFGFAMPNLDIFNRDGAAPEELDDVPFVIRSASQAALHEWVFEMEDGSVWRQVDGRVWVRPRAGQTAVVSRAALGAYMMKIDDGRAFRVRRER